MDVAPNPALSGPLNFLLDTGANVTMVEDALVAPLGVRPVRYVPVTGVSGKTEDYPLYFVSLVLGMARKRGAPHEILHSVPIAIVGMPKLNVQGILGRDFMQFFTIMYDGPNSAFEMTLHPTYRSEPPKHE